MPEGVANPGGDVVDVGPRDRGRPPRPPDDPDKAPRGWTWDAKERDWRPSRRGQRRRDNGPSDGTTSEGRIAERDPEPARFARETEHHASTSPDPKRVRALSEEDRQDMEAVLAFAGLLLLPPLANMDPICGGAAADSWPKISAALVPIIARSSSMTEWVTKTGGLRDWLALGAALAPVGGAVARHHLFHTVALADDELPAENREDLRGYVA